MRFTLFNLETYVRILVGNLYNFPAPSEQLSIILLKVYRSAYYGIVYRRLYIAQLI